MRIVAALVIVAMMAPLAACDEAKTVVPTLDATSDDTLINSGKAIQATLSPGDVSAFNAAVIGIALDDLRKGALSTVAAHPGNDPTGDERLLAAIRAEEQGKTGPEILAIARERGLSLR